MQEPIKPRWDDFEHPEYYHLASDRYIALRLIHCGLEVTRAAVRANVQIFSADQADQLLAIHETLERMNRKLIRIQQEGG